MNSFSSRIKDIEARLIKLKTLGLSSASSLTIAKKNLTVRFQVVPQRTVGGEVLDCGSSKVAYIIVTPINNPVALAVMYLRDLNSLYNDRYYGTNYYYSGGSYIFRVVIYGSSDDLRRLNNGETLPVENYNFRIDCSSDFNYSVIYEDNDQ